MWIAVSQFIVGVVLIVWSAERCTKLDVATGRRDRGALRDDYGSNRGWYWPWTPLCQLGALMALAAPITLAINQ